MDAATVATAAAVAVAVIAAGLSLVVTGCSGTGAGGGSGPGSTSRSGSGSSVTGAGTGSRSSSGNGSTQTGSTGQLTGAQLTRALLPASDFPASFAVSQQGSADSGSSLEKAAATYDVSTMSCTDWDNYFTGAGFGETAYTSDSVASSTKDQSYGQSVYQFGSSAAASRFFGGVQSLPGRCRSFTASGGGAAGRVTMQPAAAAPIDGHQAFWIMQAATVVGESSKSNTLFALEGTDVYAVSASGTGAPAPSSPAAETLVRKLIASVASHH
ncbi:MAG TPA: hypothetical protein VF070_43220 [Streptosporangiaceae bacterium]